MQQSGHLQLIGLKCVNLACSNFVHFAVKRICFDRHFVDEFNSEVIPDTDIALRFPEIDFAVVISTHDSNSDRTNN